MLAIRDGRSNQGLVSRRTFLRIGALGLGGLTLADLLRCRAAAAATGAEVRNTSVILLWMGGGPSHFETFDPKPDAPAEYRGPLGSIPTRLPGIRFGELLPRLAQLADRLAIVRSVAHRESGHGSGVKNLNTGYLHPPNTNEGTFLYPAVGAIVAKVRENERRALPPYVCVPKQAIFKDDVGGGAYLGPAYDPWGVAPPGPRASANPLTLPLELTRPRLENRQALLRSLDTLRRDVDGSGLMEGMDAFTRRAFEMVTGPAAREALDLSREPATIRERYGTVIERGHAWGQSCLLARRLVEAGVSFVGVELEGWDDHSQVATNMRRRAPVFDTAVSALIEDLCARGLDRQVLVLAWGEFGRTPRVNSQGGRDHWPASMSVLLAGGGLRLGQVVGSTNARGERPQDRPFHPNDVLATVYRHLGIDLRTAFINPQGRPIPILPHGQPIAELF